MASASTKVETLRTEEAHRALPAPEKPKELPPPSAPQGSSRARKWIILLLILLAVGAAIWKIRSNRQTQDTSSRRMAAAGDRPVPVQTQTVQQRTMPIYLTALGTVTAYNTVTIKSRVDGQLIHVNFREGQAVRKGDLLLEIDPGPYQAALAQAQGQLTRDQASSKNADAEASRYTALYQAGVVSRESQQTQLSTAGQVTGSLQADQAAIQAAKVNLAYTRITSPIDGVIGLRQVDVGNIVHSSDANGLLVVTQIHPIAVIFTLPEDYLPQVLQLTRGGHKLTVEAYDRSETNHLGTGSLLTVDNQIDTTTGTVKAKAVFDNKEGTLFPNQFVNVRLVLQQRQNAIVVPSVAIQTGTQGSFVYRVKQGEPPADKQQANASNGGGAAGGRSGRRQGASAGGPSGAAGSGAGGADGQQRGPSYYVEMAPVKVDVTEGTQVILADGVNQGDQIVVDGQEKLKDGSRVSPRQGAPTGAGRGIGASGQPGARAGSGNGDAQHSGSSAAGVGAANGPATAAGDASGQRQGAQRDRQSNAQQGNRGQRP